jgi:ribosomal-protein-alanine N-acetyltransferase
MLNHCGSETIETKRLILRKFGYNDTDDMLKYWISDTDIQLMYSEPVYSTKEEVGELLKKYIDSYENKDYYRWALIHKEKNVCIGQIAFFLVDNKNHFGEIEYCVGKDFQGAGLATEAACALIDFGFEKVNFHRIQICHKEHNLASKGVIKKCGFKFEGGLRDFFFMGDTYVTRMYYSLLKDEWHMLYKS